MGVGVSPVAERASQHIFTTQRAAHARAMAQAPVESDLAASLSAKLKRAFEVYSRLFTGFAIWVLGFRAQG